MSASFGEVCWFRGGLVFVAEVRLFPSLRMALRFSLRAPFIELFEIIGLGSSLGVGDGRTGAAVLCAIATGGNVDLDTFVRGVGRTGAPAPSIHDFCRAPPKRVLSVAFDESTSLSDRAGCPSLSGGRRIA